MSIFLRSFVPAPLISGDISFEIRIEKGSGVTIVAPNGSGKSSFINYIKHNRDNLLKGYRLSFLDQKPLTPISHLTPRHFFSHIMHDYSSISKYEKLENLGYLREFGIESKLDTPIAKLSGGENQIVKIISSLLIKSDLYIWDEPANNLDQSRIEQLLLIIKRELDSGASFLMVDHTNEISSRLSFQSAVLKRELNGQITLSNYG